MNVSSAVGSYAAMSQSAQAKSPTSTSGEIEAIKRASSQAPQQAVAQQFSATQARAPEGVKGNTLSVYA